MLSKYRTAERLENDENDMTKTFTTKTQVWLDALYFLVHGSSPGPYPVAENLGKAICNYEAQL